jgi:hypothetical protein
LVGVEGGDEYGDMNEWSERVSLEWSLAKEAMDTVDDYEENKV